MVGTSTGVVGATTQATMRGNIIVNHLCLLAASAIKCRSGGETARRLLAGMLRLSERTR
jgi:hypothetical protein